MTNLLGYRLDELVGKELWEIGLLKDEEASRMAFLELQKSCYLRYEHLPLQSKTGELHDVEFVSNLYDEAGRPVIQCNIRDITKHKHTEQQLTLLAVCVANLNEIVIITEADLLDELGPKIVFVNAAFERITGYTSAEVIGRSPRFLQGEKTERPVLDEIRRALIRQKPIRRRIISYTKDGREVCFDMDIVPVFDAKGGCTHFAATSRDITEEQKAQEQMRWKTAFFESQVNSALDGILIVGNDGKKILQNQRMVDLWEIPQEIAGQVDDGRQLDWVTSHTRYPAQFAEQVGYLVAHPDATSHDEIELSNGNVFDRYSAPVRDHDGKHYGRIWSFRDVSGRKQAEAQIVEQAAFLDEAQDAITVRALTGEILRDVSGRKQAEAQSGTSFSRRGAGCNYVRSLAKSFSGTREPSACTVGPQEAMGHDGGELLSTFAEKFAVANGQTIQKGEWAGELQHHTKTKREIIVEARWTLIRDKEGFPKAVLAINSDITEKKKLEAQFMRAQRMESIGTLAGGIAHDLNNILAPILMSIDLLKLRSGDPDAKQLLQIIKVSAQRGADLVRQVLSFARGVEGKRVEIQPRLILNDLHQIIKDTFPKDIRLQFIVPNETWTLSVDPTQIYQVLLNLCVNARDAMPNGGDLTVSMENRLLDEHYAAMNIHAKTGHYVKISVTDSGTGMPQGLIDKIFEPFFTTKELNKGTGLGLSTVMAIMKSHAGFINVYSEEGKGTVFNVYLPALDFLSTVAQEPVEEVRLPRGNGETVLLIDDEASILAITSQTLQSFGYLVLTATDGADAVAVYAQHRQEIALVVTDMMMPVMGGVPTIRALMRINPLVRIVAVSGLTSNDSTAKESGSGVKHFLTKPYTAETLLTTIRRILDGVE